MVRYLDLIFCISVLGSVPIRTLFPTDYDTLASLTLTKGVCTLPRAYRRGFSFFSDTIAARLFLLTFAALLLVVIVLAVWR
jgi:hypothetical protein